MFLDKNSFVSTIFINRKTILVNFDICLDIHYKIVIDISLTLLNNRGLNNTIIYSKS